MPIPLRPRFRIPRAELWLFLLLWSSYAYFYQSAKHNEAARFDQIRTLLEDGSVAIDRFAYNTADVVEYARDGVKHVYPAKAPGTTFLGTIPFWVVSKTLLPFGLAPALHWHLVAYFTTILTVGLLSALSGVVMFRVLFRMTGDLSSAALAVIAVWLGSIAFPFSTLFFSHQHVAAQLVFAFAILFGLAEARIAAAPLRAAGATAAAGFLIGFSITSEYPSVLLGTLLAAYLVFRLFGSRIPARTRVTIGASFVAGAAVAVSLLALYNLAAFGRLAYTAYHQLGAGGGFEMFRSHSQGFAGVSWPGFEQFREVLAEITVRPQRGLLYLGREGSLLYACSPVLWLALPGLLLLAFKRGLRAEALLATAMIAVYFTFNACYGDSIVFWGGGASVGPRHVIPVLPFAAIPVAFVARRLKIVFIPLLMVSVFYMLIATAVEPRTPYRPVNPWSGMYLPAYLEGRFALADDGLFSPGERITANSTAFNLAKLARVPGDWQLAPLMAMWLIFGTLLIREVRDEGPSGVRSIAWVPIGALAIYTVLVALGPSIAEPPPAKVAWQGLMTLE